MILGQPDARLVLNEVSSPDEKATIAEQILMSLPDWFGLPGSTKTYIEECRELPFFAAFVDKRPVGFVSLQQTAKQTGEIHCMGVLPGLHRQGIGKLLLSALEKACEDKEYRLLQVKTVDTGHYPASYDKTVAFYEGMGFVRLEVFPEMWDPWNPCLILVKALSQKGE